MRTYWTIKTLGGFLVQYNSMGMIRKVGFGFGFISAA